MTTPKRIVTIYSSDGLVLNTLSVSPQTRQVALVAMKGSTQMVVDIDQHDRVFFPLRPTTVCLGHG